MPARTVSEERKTIYDPVHGTITLDGTALALVRHPAFQRLWGIRQTGFAHLVFPGANHTRLEHSLGVYWVAQRFARALDLDAETGMRAALAGLLHDLGHPPFSHTLDPSMREVLGQTHEAISRKWITGRGPSESGWLPEEGADIPAILNGAGIRASRVADLVDPPAGSKDRKLVAMLHGAIDADRIDYLQRDAHYTGVAHGAIDAVRLLDTVREWKGRLVFAEKGRSAVEGFLVGRALMYSSVYYHKTVRAAEVMAQAAVERLPGYPESGRALLFGTDGELLVALEAGGGRSAELVRAILRRRLFKRAFGFRELSERGRTRWRAMAEEPVARRALEDELARRMSIPRAGVLFDLSGLDPRGATAGEWAEVGLLEGNRVEHPFRAPSLWQTLALRPPAYWAVSVYVDPRHRARAERALPRLLPRLLP